MYKGGLGGGGDGVIVRSEGLVPRGTFDDAKWPLALHSMHTFGKIIALSAHPSKQLGLN